MKGTLPGWYELVPARHKGRRAYGLRSVRCSCCSKLFRREDVSPETGRCLWCVYDHLSEVEKVQLDTAARLL